MHAIVVYPLAPPHNMHATLGLTGQSIPTGINVVSQRIANRAILIA
jgi:hypothetical protein